MARVDDDVVHDAFMNAGRLVRRHSGDAIEPQRLPCSHYLAVALHADPEHYEVTEDRSQSLLTSSTVEKDVVDDDACSTGSNRGKAEIPRCFKVSPPWTDNDLPGFADMKQGTILNPPVGHRPDQVIDAECQPR